MPINFIPDNKRGHVSSGWLKSAHSFSFGRYVNPERRGFGTLLVVNEDWIAPGAGFSEHPHQNMEIITIPLEGSLEHQDSMGNKGVVMPGEIQAMSAGTGVLHSEWNASKTEPLHLLQIWIKPDRMNVPPRYGQWTCENKLNDWSLVASPENTPGHFPIFQQAEIKFGKFLAGQQLKLKSPPRNHGLYILFVSGTATFNDVTLNPGDSLEITGTIELPVEITSESKILLIQAPV